MNQFPKCDFCLKLSSSLAFVRVGNEHIGDICSGCEPGIRAHIVELQRPEAREYYAKLKADTTAGWNVTNG